MKVRHVRVLAGRSMHYCSSRTWKKLRYAALIAKQKNKKLSKSESEELKKLEKKLSKFLQKLKQNH